MNMLAITKKIFPILLGTAAGYAYWYFIGCMSGTCPITASWYTSTVYGALVGATWLLPGRRRKSSEQKLREQTSPDES